VQPTDRHEEYLGKILEIKTARQLLGLFNGTVTTEEFVRQMHDIRE
jgi:predicted Zn-dependent protease with MMP-like domain